MNEIILPKLSPAAIFVSKDSEFSKNSDILTKHNYKEVYIPKSNLVLYVAEENKEVIFTDNILKAIIGAQVCINGFIYKVYQHYYGDILLEKENIFHRITSDDIIIGTIFSYDYKYTVNNKTKNDKDPCYFNLVRSNNESILQTQGVSNDWCKDIQSGIFTTIKGTLIQIKDGKKTNLFYSQFIGDRGRLINNPYCYTKLIELKGEFIKPIYIDLDNGNILSYKTETAKELFFDNLLNNKVNRFRKVGLQPSRLFTVNNSGLEKYILSTLSNANIDIETIFKKELEEYGIEHYLFNSSPAQMGNITGGTYYVSPFTHSFEEVLQRIDSGTIQNNSGNVTWSLDVNSSNDEQLNSPF